MKHFLALKVVRYIPHAWALLQSSLDSFGSSILLRASFSGTQGLRLQNMEGLARVWALNLGGEELPYESEGCSCDRTGQVDLFEHIAIVIIFENEPLLLLLVLHDVVATTQW